MMQTNQPVYIIAEAGVNHNGDMKLAKQLIDIAVDAKADAVKFQSFRADKLASKSAPKAEYQLKTTGNAESQYEMLKKLELSPQMHLDLLNYCNMKGIQFLSSPFDAESVDYLAKDLNLPILKIPSGELINAELLMRAGLTGKKIILSTGMSQLAEIHEALGVLAFAMLSPSAKPSREAFRKSYRLPEARQLLADRVVVLQCTTEYPTPFEQVNLRVMSELQSELPVAIGFSDHTVGYAVPVAAVACGACVIEKHFTLDKTLPGPDQKASLDPIELKSMVEAIRQVEKALGQGHKEPTSAEEKNMVIARKSLVAAVPIRKGEKFTCDNITSKRPGSGRSPMDFWDLIGTVADRDYQPDEELK